MGEEGPSSQQRQVRMSWGKGGGGAGVGGPGGKEREEGTSSLEPEHVGRKLRRRWS